MRNIAIHIWEKRALYSFMIFVITLFPANDVCSEDFSKISMTEDLREMSYPEIGLTTAGINLGYWHKRYGLRLSQYYLGEDHSNMVINIGYTLSDTGKTQKSINLVAGRFAGSDPGADYDFAYAGIAYGLNFSILGYRGFFLEIGIAKVIDDNLGNLADDPFVPCTQIGYVYRFIPKEKK